MIINSNRDTVKQVMEKRPECDNLRLSLGFKQTFSLAKRLSIPLNYDLVRISPDNII